MSFSSGGGAPSPPKLKKINIGTAEKKALKADEQSYALSDADWAKRFPMLPIGREFMIGDAESQLGGGVAPQTTRALRTAGLGDEASRIVGRNEFETAQNLGQGILDKEQRDRNFAENLIKQNPPRTFGLSGSDAVKILEANTGNANAYNQAAFGTANNAYDAGIAQNAQTFGAITSAIGSLAGIGAKAYGSHYTDPFSTIYTPYGFSGGGFSYAGGPGYNSDLGEIQPYTGG